MVPHKGAEVMVGKPKEGATPEDRSYAEWFVWARRGGAAIPACHAAAQGAVRALAAGSDVNEAAKIAAQSMAVPPTFVDSDLSQYCAWFSIAHIDEGYDAPRAHTFADAACKALAAGMNAANAHQAGMAAIGLAAPPAPPPPPPTRV